MLIDLLVMIFELVDFFVEKRAELLSMESLLGLRKVVL
jgi:hypothetical protein